MAASNAGAQDFPILCQTCLGDNPYVRMVRSHMSSECNVCKRPFTSFKWKAGTEGRVKSTIICANCAKAKSACQTCLFDLATGLPLQVRDSLLKKQGMSVGMDLARPQSEAMVKYQADQVAKGLAISDMAISPLASQALQGMAKNAPDYRRNRSKICSFFIKGTCNRGDTCPFRHEQSDHTDITLAAQNIQDRYYGTSDPLAKKILDRVNDPKNAQTAGPEVSTVWVSGIAPEKKITDQDLKDHFYAFGEVVRIHSVAASKCAFIEFATHDQASNAIDNLRNNLVIRGTFLKVGWAKPQNKSHAAADPTRARNTTAPPPPGFVPYDPIAPGAPPPGAAGPLGWAPLYYPSMNPQRMGSSDSPQAKDSPQNKTGPQQGRKPRSTRASTAAQVEEPASDKEGSIPNSPVPSSTKASSSVSISEVVPSEDGEVPAGSRVKRSGGADGPDEAVQGRATKKAKK